MRLLKRSPGGDFELISFNDDDSPPYAILSHTWTEGQEVTYNELVARTGKGKTGYTKIRFCSSSTELSTAINSMFRWYRRASKCYVYLSDISVPGATNAEAFRITWEESFRRSRWFTRGWTLQELLAPATVEFFSKEGKRLGSRISLEQEIHEITEIPIGVLKGQSITEFSVEERMSWAATRTTTLKEDKVYCLLGIFGVFLSLIYGEGEAYATLRLKEEIQKRQDRRETECLQGLTMSSLLPFPRNELFVGREKHLQSLEQFLLPSNAHRRMAICGLGGCGKSALALEFAYRALARHAKHLVFWLLGRRITKQALLNNKLAVDELLDILTYLPLAIVQAAAFINNNNISVSEYILLFRQTGSESELFSEHFEDFSRYREMDSTIAKTWHISFDQIRKQNRLAAEYLSFIACIDRINIPQSLLPPGSSLVQKAKALGTLTGYAFITERQQTVQELDREKFFDMHRLVHMASVWWLDGRNERATWAGIAVARLEKLVPYGGHEKKEIWTTYLSHAIHVAGLNSAVDDTAKASLLDRYSVAETVHRQVLLLRENKLGKEHTQTLISMSELGIVLDYQGKYKEAESVNRQTLARREKVLGNLALVLDSQGKYEESESMNRQTLARREKVLGPEHPGTLTSISNLAAVLERQGKYEEAESMNRQTLARKEKVLGFEHPDTLMSHEEAESMNRQTLARWEKVLGPEHPDTLTSMSNLALVLSSQGEYEEAESMNRQTLARREKVLGLEHPDTLTSYEEAESMYRQTLARREKVLGPEHPGTLTSISNLAAVLERQGKYEEAESMNRQTLAQREKVLGPEHPDTLMSVYCLAHLLANRHHYNESLILYERAYAAYSTVFGIDHPATRACRRHYSEMLALQEHD
ncbi:kinesin light chain 1 [Bisporella sp. PMI_857]|nr:kinesin light chain 1 [Bisporella sp. PMI_857]